MKTYLDCIPCFFNQVLKTMRMLRMDESMQDKAMKEMALLVSEMDTTMTPPWNSRRVYDMINRLAGTNDPFLNIKKESNQLVLKLYPKLKQKVIEFHDPLAIAVHLSIVGNIIDYGVNYNFDIEESIDKYISYPIAVYHFKRFKEILKRAENILYLGDNTGEIVFDRLLIETITDTIGKNITFVVRENPIINDALMEDAEFVGMNKVARVISNGTGFPGTVIDKCSEELQNLFYGADLIISKGQGNFESLSEIHAPICFLFMVKCAVVSRHVETIFRLPNKLNLGDLVLGFRTF
ncbi:Damage-control phosphatase ARMT1-like metal-binding domain-containing protein [Candidatus Magnetomoraceae bacterium gMMP-15]